MALTPANAARFNQPEKHLAIDLINRTHQLFFGYDEIDFEQPVPLAPSEVMGTLNTAVDIRYVRRPDHPRRMRYRRLDLATFFGEGEHVFGFTLGHTSKQALLENIFERWGLRFGYEAVSLDLAPRGDDTDGAMDVTLRANDGSLAWVGEVALVAYTDNHLAVHLPANQLAGLDYDEAA